MEAALSAVRISRVNIDQACGDTPYREALICAHWIALAQSTE
jgi:hypothetical protein